ncbi:hypothetical protein CRYUN_Cryun26dG0049800 [Craigia yunnanensis]
MCGDATNWDEEANRESILREREIQTRTVFRTVWAPSLNPNPECVVVASSDGVGNCFVYFVAWLSLSQAQAESCQCSLICGDDGKIKGWRWKEFTESEVPVTFQGNHVKPVLDLVNPQHKGPWGALSPIPENNAIAVDPQGGSIFTAAGDSCAYCWDVEKSEIKMVFKGHSDYLHCIVARATSNQIITGSEDGTARIWDCKSGKCIKVIDPLKDRKLEGLISCVSCIALDASESCRASIQDVVFHDNQVTAIGGYGGLVDVISQFGSHLCTFRSHYV